MEAHFAGQDLQVTIPFSPPYGGAVSDVSEASYLVRDIDGVIVVPVTALTPALADTAAVILIPAAVNTLAVGEVRSYRQVELTFVHEGRSSKVYYEYVIEAADLLTVGLNSFQSYAQASMRSLDLAGVDDFTSATREARIPALVNAYHNLCSLTYHINGQTYANIGSLTAQEFEALPEHFRSMIGLAQVIEANEAMTVFSVHKKRQAGLMSETIGESSMMFRPEKVLLVPVTRRSMDMLRGYISWGMQIGRA